MAKFKFQRSKGFVGSTPREWIDKNLPTCPFCRDAKPKWEQATEGRLRFSLYHFRCPSCHGEVSIPVAVVGGGGISSGPNLLGAMTARLFRIESTGTSGSALKVGRMISPEELRKLGFGSSYEKDEKGIASRENQMGGGTQLSRGT